MHVCYVHAIASMWKSGDTLCSHFSPSTMGSKDQIWVVSLVQQAPLPTEPLHQLF